MPFVLRMALGDADLFWEINLSREPVLLMWQQERPTRSDGHARILITPERLSGYNKPQKQLAVPHRVADDSTWSRRLPGCPTCVTSLGEDDLDGWRGRGWQPAHRSHGVGKIVPCVTYEMGTRGFKLVKTNMLGFIVTLQPPIGEGGGMGDGKHPRTS